MPRPKIYQVRLTDEEVKKLKLLIRKKQLQKRSVCVVRLFLIWMKIMGRY